MKYFLGISNFLEEISSLSYSIVFLCFLALITAALLNPSLGASPFVVSRDPSFRKAALLNYGFCFCIK